jgi:hypothetical protein
MALLLFEAKKEIKEIHPKRPLSVNLIIPEKNEIFASVLLYFFTLIPA